MLFRSNSGLQVNRALGPAVSGMPPRFDAQKTYWFAFPEVLATGDVTGDGRPDVLVSVSYSTSPGYVAMFKNISH